MSLSDVEYADGYEPCELCGERPAFGDPWTQVHRGTRFWSHACANCWLEHDDGLALPREKDL